MYDLSYSLNEPDDVHTMMQKAVGMRPITVVEMDGGMVAKVSGVDVPDVYFESRYLLVQEFIAGAHLEPAAHEDACRQRAAFQEVTLSKARPGSTTLDGWIEIPTPWTDPWIEFFRDH
jgi:hypothetical protein